MPVTVTGGCIPRPASRSAANNNVKLLLPPDSALPAGVRYTPDTVMTDSVRLGTIKPKVRVYFLFLHMFVALGVVGKTSVLLLSTADLWGSSTRLITINMQLASSLSEGFFWGQAL